MGLSATAMAAMLVGAVFCVAAFLEFRSTSSGRQRAAVYVSFSAARRGVLTSNANRQGTSLQGANPFAAARLHPAPEPVHIHTLQRLEATTLTNSIVTRMEPPGQPLLPAMTVVYCDKNPWWRQDYRPFYALPRLAAQQTWIHSKNLSAPYRFGWTTSMADAVLRKDPVVLFRKKSNDPLWLLTQQCRDALLDRHGNDRPSDANSRTGDSAAAPALVSAECTQSLDGKMTTCTGYPTPRPRPHASAVLEDTTGLVDTLTAGDGPSVMGTWIELERVEAWEAAVRSELFIVENIHCKGPFIRWAQGMRRAATQIPAADIELGERPGVGVWNPATWGPKAIHRSFDPPRPIMFDVYGEVFFGDRYPDGDGLDGVMYRSGENAAQATVNFNYVEGFAHLFGIAHQWGKRYPKLFEATPRRELPAAATVDRPFCAMMHRNLLNREMYYIDAVIRFSIFELLSEYKQCKHLAKDLQPDKVSLCEDGLEVDCASRYKFFIAAENTMERSYVTEKLWHALLSDAVPIYFGAPSIHHFANPEAFVNCAVTPGALADLRTFYPAPGAGGTGRALTFKNGTVIQAPDIKDEMLLAYFTSYLRPTLKPCIDRIIAIDKDPDAYSRMLRAPILNPAVPQRDLLGGELADEIYRMWTTLGGKPVATS